MQVVLLLLSLSASISALPKLSSSTTNQTQIDPTTFSTNHNEHSGSSIAWIENFPDTDCLSKSISRVELKTHCMEFNTPGEGFRVHWGDSPGPKDLVAFYTDPRCKNKPYMEIGSGGLLCLGSMMMSTPAAVIWQHGNDSEPIAPMGSPGHH